MKLNVGCGARILAGWVNIDIQAHPGTTPDILADLRSIPLPDECADEVMAIHVFEHFYLWEAEEVLSEWRRLLKPGGRLVLELPDLAKCCKNILELLSGDRTVKAGKDPDQIGMWGLYGDPRLKDPFMCHRWGWTGKTLQPFLSARGFRVTDQVPTQFHPVGRHLRDMRIEARKC